MKKRTVENVTLAMFAIGLAMLAFVGVVSYRANSRLISDQVWVTHSYEVLASIDRVDREVDDLDDALQAYVLTGDSLFRRQAVARRNALGQDITVLAQLTSDNPQQQKAVFTLRATIEDRLQQLAPILSGATEQQASSSDVRRAGTLLRPAVHQQLDHIKSEEIRLLDQRQTTLRDRGLHTRIVIVIGTTLALVIVATATMLLRRDAYEKKSSRRRVGVQHATTRILSESTSLDQAATRLLPELALSLDFDASELWMLDAAEKQLRCLSHYYSDAISPELETSVGISIPVGVGIPGRVYSQQEPLWIEDIGTMTDLPRYKSALASKIKTVIAVPVLIWPETAGVLLLISRTQWPQDKEILQTLSAIGAQVGQFITRRRAIDTLRETTELQRAILESANFSIIATDANGVIKSVNSTAEKMLGYRADDLIGKQTPLVLHDSEEVARRAAQLSLELNTEIETDSEVLFARPRRGDLDEGEWTYVRADGTRFPVHLSISALSTGTGEISGFVAIGQDITERREVDRMKNEFISVVSHELRTPLTSIRGSLGLLASGMLGNVAEKAQRMLQIAIKNTDRLVRLINDILDIERLESGKIALDRKPVSAESLVVQATDAMRGMAEKANVTLEIQAADSTVNADADRIVQTLTNLISNATKFSNAGSTVTISTRVENGCALFSVHDRGRGIPEEKQEAIFERFQQVDASDSREKGGTGLGLAICRTIIQQHGGRIWVDSKLGEGSTFHFTVPLAEPEPKAPVKVEQTGPRVLVCDDDPWLLSVIGNLLNAAGFVPVLAGSGSEMLSKARVERPDVVLLDLVMPGMSGWEALTRLRADEHLSDVPVIILSGLSERENSGSSVSDVSGWVQKPFDSTQLLSAISSIAQQSRKLVLLVEDDTDLAGVIETTLARDGIEVLVASRAAEARELAKLHMPELLILDLHLKEGTGYDIVRELRLHDVLRNVPVVVYSASDVSSSDREHLRLGKTEFLTKARVSPEQLERLVTQILRREEIGEGEHEQANPAR